MCRKRQRRDDARVVRENAGAGKDSLAALTKKAYANEERKLEV
jgi:hypothetical protein